MTAAVRVAYWGTITALAHAGTWFFVMAAVVVIVNYKEISPPVIVAICSVAAGLLVGLRQSKTQ